VSQIPSVFASARRHRARQSGLAKKSLMNGNASGFGKKKKYTPARARTHIVPMERWNLLINSLLAAVAQLNSRESLSQPRGRERGLTSRRSNKMSNNPAGNEIREIIQDSRGERRSLRSLKLRGPRRTKSGLFFSANLSPVVAYGRAGGPPFTFPGRFNLTATGRTVDGRSRGCRSRLDLIESGPVPPEGRFLLRLMEPRTRVSRCYKTAPVTSLVQYWIATSSRRSRESRVNTCWHRSLKRAISTRTL